MTGGRPRGFAIPDAGRDGVAIAIQGVVSIATEPCGDSSRNDRTCCPDVLDPRTLVVAGLRSGQLGRRAQQGLVCQVLPELQELLRQIWSGAGGLVAQEHAPQLALVGSWK